MSEQNSHYKHLKKRQLELKNEIYELENILSFKNKKQSLSVLTNGLTDHFLSEMKQENGEKTLALKSGGIVKYVGERIFEKKKNKSLVNFDHNQLNPNIIESGLKIGSMFFLDNFIRKKLYSKSWKTRLIGSLATYIVPIAIGYIRHEIENYQKKQSVKSLEKLI